MALQKTSHELQLSLTAFQRAQKVSVERQRTVVEGVKIAVEDDNIRSLCVISISRSCGLPHMRPQARDRIQ